MQIFKMLTIVVFVLFAIAYWRGSRPKQEIDWSEVESREREQKTLQAPPDFTLMDLSGKKFTLSSLRGKPVLLHFWATWCPPCLDELPSLLKFADWAKRSLGLETIAVSVDQDRSLVEKFLAEKKLWPKGPLPLTILMDTKADVAQAYGSAKYPETFFIDSTFKIIRKFVGSQDWTSQEIMKWMTERAKSP